MRLSIQEQDGSIDIEIAPSEKDRNQIVCRVTDDGPGMAEETQAHLFERFYKGTHSATSNGLGLAIAQMIVQLHGGTIEVESTPGEGSTFIITLTKNI